MAENEEFKYGVKKEIIEKKIEDYSKILEREFSDDQNPIVVLKRLETELESILKEENGATSSPEMQHLIQDIKSRRAEKEEEIRELLEKEKDYIKASYVIDELKKLLTDSKEEYSFVEIEQIEKRLDLYKGILKNLDLEGFQKKKAELQKELEDAREELESLRSKASQPKQSEPVDISDEIAEKVREEKIKELKSKIANRRAMIVARGKQLHKNRYEELYKWEEQLELLTNPEKRDRESKETQARISELEKIIAGKENQLSEVEKQISDLDGRSFGDINSQKRYVESNIEELESLAKAKELFKINEKGQVEVKYPAITPEIDVEAIKTEYEMRRRDMLDKFYGNRKKGAEYKDRLYRLEDHIIDKDFEFTDKDGARKVGVYQTVEDYPEMQEDLTFLQLEEIVERIERRSKKQAGDLSVYSKFDDPEKAFKEDDDYVATDNHAYNGLLATSTNLMTLGKYGEKVPYSKMQEGQIVRNIFRGIGNAAKFFRNHVTAPINKFIGSKIVAPIYDRITGVETGTTAGVYSNKRTHRYVARRDYFQSQGQGYFKSRWNSIFKAKEGNAAILSAGAHDIKQSIVKKYTEMAQREAVRKQTEFMDKSLDEQIEMIKKDLEAASPENRKKLELTLEDLNAAKAQVAGDRTSNEEKKISQTVQTDAIGLDQHYVANKENVTRTITGVKMLTRLGIRKFVGPKIKEWLLKHTTKEVPIEQPTDVKVPNKTNPKPNLGTTEPTPGVTTPGTLTPEPLTPDSIDTSGISSDISMRDLMSSNAGKQIEGYYSVYGGEARPAMYSLTGNEKVTAIFKSVGNGGTGLSDVSGLQAPVLTDGTFASNLLDANGVLSQDVSLDTLMDAIGNVDAESLSGLYVSVGDRYWVKLSDLCKDLDLTPVKSAVAETAKKAAETVENLTTSVTDLPVTDIDAAEIASKVTKSVTEGVKVATRTVENTRVTNVLKALGIAYNIGDAGLTAEDIYENARRTETEEPKVKQEPREYESEEKFTGSREEDYRAIRKKKPSKTKEDDGEER